MEKIIQVTPWCNSTLKKTIKNSCYGIRIPTGYYGDLCTWKQIKFEAFDYLVVRKPTTPFTEKCPEIRSKFFKTFFESKNIIQCWNLDSRLVLQLYLESHDVWILRVI